MKLIDGKKIASEILTEIKAIVTALPHRKPGLAFILVGDNPASQTYVSAKTKACALTGIDSRLIKLPFSTQESELCAQIEKLNRDPTIDGILVQLPLPSHIREQQVMLAIDPTKDVDGFHPLNAGKMLQGDPSAIIPCTPLGIKVLLQKSHISVEGKHVVIVGRSNIVGKPLAALLMQKKPGCNATVTVCHSTTENLPTLTRTADILIAAIGRPRFITHEMIRPGATVIDVGINREGPHLLGDVDFTAIAPLCSHITPVPGGVGPMTIAMLLQNTLESYLKKIATHQ